MIISIDDWMNLLASRGSDKILNLWLQDQEEFYNRYFILDSPGLITICDKINKTFKDYSKYVETFKINNQGSNKKKEKISLVKFKGWELSKEKEL